MRAALAIVVATACGGAPVGQQTPRARPAPAKADPAGKPIAATPGGAAPVRPPPAPAPAKQVAWTELSGTIKRVDVTSARDKTLVHHAKELFEPEIGKPLDRWRLRDVLAKLMAVHGVADVELRGEQLADGIALVVDITGQPIVHGFAAREAGGAAIALPGQLATAVGLPLDPALLDSIADDLRSRYRRRGFRDAVAGWRTTKLGGGGEVDVAIEVDTGKLTTIDGAQFRGASHAKQADLVAALGSELAPNTPWLDDRVERLAQLVTDWYLDRGFVNVKVKVAPPAGEHGPIVFTIDEGDLFKLGKLDFAGVPAKEAKRLVGRLGIKRGDAFSRAKIADAMKKLGTELHGAAVTPITNVDTAKKTIDIRFEISK